MTIQTIPTAPIDGQKPGTSGLRKKVTDFAAPGYLETYTQAIFDAISPEGAVLVMGGTVDTSIVTPWRPFYASPPRTAWRALLSAKMAFCRHRRPAI